MREIEEEWRPIKGFESLYEVSNLGNVRSLDRVIYSEKRSNQIWKGKQLSIKKKNKGGYHLITLNKNGKQYYFTIHRLVAEAFIPNPLNLPQVNHKDENKSNNRVENLEWCTESYNHNYGTAIERANLKRNVSVNQYTLTMEFVKQWKSMKDVERELGIGAGNISHCCKHHIKHAGGFIWRYA